jgi:hypothetical protein
MINVSGYVSMDLRCSNPADNFKVDNFNINFAIVIVITSVSGDP